LGPSLLTKVWIPQSAVNWDPKRGYCRFRCATTDLKAATVSSTSSTGTVFQGGKSQSFVPGLLNRHLSRIGGDFQWSAIRMEQMISSGIPQTSLSGILCSIIEGLNKQMEQPLNTSLVHQLDSRARFLGVGFCRVQAECSRCFGVLRKAMEANEGLVCPNGCQSSASHRSIKWECSGTIDDGTGQAKLYAEREAAMCLLGVSPKLVSYIEEGVWKSAKMTIQFSKSVPIKTSLGKSLHLAIASASASNRVLRRKMCTPNMDDILLQMDAVHRAEYLIQWHCRSSPEPTRRRVYFVKCKALPKLLHLSQTELELSNGSRRVSYSLPPLKLLLVDCGRSPT